MKPTAQARFEIAQKRLAFNVRAQRTARGLSQAELARHAGISQAQVGAIERSKGNPTIDNLQRIADALSINVATLFAKRQ